MKPTAFSYAEYSKLEIDMERKNEYVNALKAENERLRKQLDAAVELIDEIRNDDTGDIGYIFFKIDKWRGKGQSDG